MDIIEENFWVQCKRYPHLYINVRNKRKSDCDTTPLLMLHGTMLPPDLNYDMKFDGLSATDLLVLAGINCYMVSAIGYGKSGMPPELLTDEPVEGSCNTYQDWIEDLSDVIEHFKFSACNILAWSGSAIPTMAISVKYPTIVNKIIIYGIADHNPIQDDTPAMTFKYFTHENMHRKRYQDIPNKKHEVIFPSHWFQEWMDCIDKHMPLKFPLGTVNDRTLIRTGKKKLSDYVRFSEVTCDTLFITGMWDTDVNLTEFYKIFKQLGSPVKRFRLIPNGSHWVIMETNRQKIIDMMVNFLNNDSQRLLYS